MIIKCDKCGEKFEMSEPSVSMFRHDVEGELEWTRFACTECGEIYTVLYKNDKMLQLEKERIRWSKQMKNPNLSKKAMKEIEKIHNLQECELRRLKEVCDA